MSNIYKGSDDLDEAFLEFKFERDEMIKGIMSTLSKRGNRGLSKDDLIKIAVKKDRAELRDKNYFEVLDFLVDDKIKTLNFSKIKLETLQNDLGKICEQEEGVMVGGANNNVLIGDEGDEEEQEETLDITDIKRREIAIFLDMNYTLSDSVIKPFTPVEDSDFCKYKILYEQYEEMENLFEFFQWSSNFIKDIRRNGRMLDLPNNLLFRIYDFYPEQRRRFYNLEQSALISNFISNDDNTKIYEGGHNGGRTSYQTDTSVHFSLNTDGKKFTIFPIDDRFILVQDIDSGYNIYAVSDKLEWEDFYYLDDEGITVNFYNIMEGIENMTVMYLQITLRETDIPLTDSRFPPTHVIPREELPLVDRDRRQALEAVRRLEAEDRWRQFIDRLSQANEVEANEVEANEVEANEVEANEVEANEVEANEVEANARANEEANAPEAERQSGSEQESNLESDIVDRTLFRINNEIRNDFSAIIPYLSDHEDGNVFFSHDPPFYLKFTLEGEEHILSWRILDLLYDNDKYLFGYGKYGLNYFVIPITEPFRKVTWVLIQKNIGDYLENKIVAYCDFDESKLFNYYYNNTGEWKTLQYENDIDNFSIEVLYEPDSMVPPPLSDIIDRDATRRGTRIPGISIENIVKFNTQHIAGLPKFITVKSEETDEDDEPRFINVFEYKRVYLKNLNGQEFPIIAYHQTVPNFTRDGNERLPNTEALLILSSKHVWNYITYDTGHQFNYVFPLYITNVSNVTLDIEDGNIGYNLGPELYNVSDGTIYGKISIGYDWREASEEIENPYLDYGYSDEDIKNEIKDYALRESGENKTIINLNQCSFQNIGLNYQLRARIGIRDDDEIVKEFNFKKIYLEIEQKTIFCYTDGPNEKSFYKFDEMERYDFIIYIKDVWVLCNFKTRVVDGEEQYRILRGAICPWSLSHFQFDSPWILTNSNLTHFSITRPFDGIVRTIDESMGGMSNYALIESYYNRIFTDIEGDLPGQVHTDSQPAPIRQESSSNDNRMRLRRVPLPPVDRGQAQPPTNRGNTRPSVFPYLNSSNRERESQPINRLPSSIYSSDDGMLLEPQREDAIIPGLSNISIDNIDQEVNFDDLRVIHFRENTILPDTNERITVMDSKIYRPDVKPEQQDYSYLFQYIERNLRTLKIDDKKINDFDIGSQENIETIVKLFKKFTVGKVEFYDATDTERGIDAGGLRPEFFDKVCQDIMKSFLQTISEKDAYEERKVTELARMETYLRNKLKETGLEYTHKNPILSGSKTDDNIRNNIEINFREDYKKFINTKMRNNKRSETGKKLTKKQKKAIDREAEEHVERMYNRRKSLLKNKKSKNPKRTMSAPSKFEYGSNKNDFDDLYCGMSSSTFIVRSFKNNKFKKEGMSLKMSYFLAGISLAKIISCDNGSERISTYDLQKVIIPNIPLSNYMKTRLLDVYLGNWLDLFACCKLDMPEVYDSLKYWDEDWNSDSYSIWDDDLPIPREFYKYLKQDKDIVKIRKEVKELRNKNEFNRLNSFVPNPKLKLSLMFLYILEKYERGLEKEYFYFTRGFRSLIEFTDDGKLEINSKRLYPKDIDNLLTGGKVNVELMIEKLQVVPYGFTITQEMAEQIKDWFIELIREYDLREEYDLIKNILYFWTSSKNITVSTEKIKIEVKYKEDEDESLPTAHTCFNTLDVHYYSSKEIFDRKLRIAAEYGTEGFGFA